MGSENMAQNRKIPETSTARGFLLWHAIRDSNP